MPGCQRLLRHRLPFDAHVFKSPASLALPCQRSWRIGEQNGRMPVYASRTFGLLAGIIRFAWDGEHSDHGLNRFFVATKESRPSEPFADGLAPDGSGAESQHDVLPDYTPPDPPASLSPTRPGPFSQAGPRERRRFRRENHRRSAGRVVQH